MLSKLLVRKPEQDRQCYSCTFNNNYEQISLCSNVFIVDFEQFLAEKILTLAMTAPYPYKIR